MIGHPMAGADHTLSEPRRESPTIRSDGWNAVSMALLLPPSLTTDLLRK
jgi:hypothetical protein